jgi:hypothetical protein
MFLPQALAFYLPGIRAWLPDRVVPVSLVASQAGLLAFAGLNRRQPGFRALGLGLALNLLVITLNGGWMPISPATLARLAPDVPPAAWTSGSRLGHTKDVILPPAETRLAVLSDRFVLPAWMPWRVAFSPGDVLLFLGAFGATWAMGGGAPASPKPRSWALAEAS